MTATLFAPKQPTTSKGGEPRPRSGLGRLLLASVALAILAVGGCETHDGPVFDPTSTDPSVAGGALGEVAALRSGVGGIEGLTASGPSGKRNLAAGDKVAAGETVQSRKGLEGTIVLRDGTSVVLHEDAHATFESSPKGAGLSLSKGGVSISRFPSADQGFELRVNNKSFSMISGRMNASTDQQGALVTVDAGETVFTGGGGDRLMTGDAIRLDAQGRFSREAAPRLAYRPPSEWVEPLAPRFLPPPPRTDVLRGIGTLTARTPGSGRKSETALDLTRHSVNVTIRDGVALTRIEEAFHNKSNRTVEGTYRFLLPSRASITRLALDVNGRIEEGEVLEKKRAARIFKTIVEDSVRPRDPALLEWKRGSTFTMKIFPIKAGETRRVFISYMEPMTAAAGHLRYVYPLGGAGGKVTVGSFSFEAEIETPLGLKQVRAPLYPAAVTAQGNRATVAFEATGFRPSTDLVVEYSPRDEPQEMRVATQTEKTGQSYAMMLLRPPVEATAKPTGSRVIALVDTSYGTTDEIRGLSAAVTVELLASLDRDDTFAVLSCDSGCRAMAPGFSPPSAEALRQAHDFLKGIEPGGASNLLGAFTEAFHMARGIGGPTNVIYVGDGVPTAGETDPGQLLRLLDRTRPAGVAVHTVGVGPDVDALLLDALAESLGGSSYQLSVGESPAVAAYGLARRVQSPGLSNVTVQWPAGIRDAYPQRIGFVPDGGEVAITAKMDRAHLSGEVVLRGTGTDGRIVERRYPLSINAAPVAPGFISRLWAKQHIDKLTLTGGAAKEIIDLSRRMRVASRLTSWIVLENQRMYDRFRVQRTDAETWDGEGAMFAQIPAEQQAQIAAGMDEDEAPGDAKDDALADGDFADDLDDLSASVGDGSLGSAIGSKASSGMGKSAGASASQPSPFYEPAPAKKPKGAPPAAAAPAMEAEAEESAKMAKSEDRERGSAKKKSIAGPTSKPSADLLGSNGYVSGGEIAGGGGLGTAWRPPPRCDNKPRYNVRISAGPPNPSAQALRKIDQRTAQVRQNPLSRNNHKRLVRLLARLGRIEQARAAAEEWRAADPLGTDALTYLADQIARHGDRFRAMRTYASIAEIDPGKAKFHRRLAQAYRDLGLFGAAAGHFRAAADSGGKPDDMRDYLYATAAAGWLPLLNEEANAALGDRKYRKVRKDVEALLTGVHTGLLPQWPDKDKGHGALTVKLVVDTPGAEIDLAVIDPLGRRVSGLWRRGATVRDLSAASVETLAVSSLRNGTYQVLVTQAAAVSGLAAAGAPITGKVVIKCRDKRRTIPFTITGSEIVAARVKYKKTKPRWKCW
jgi:tetratricopeptide (TPR) repeat protein